jgi:hypothetical protein
MGVDGRLADKVCRYTRVADTATPCCWISTSQAEAHLEYSSARKTRPVITRHRRASRALPCAGHALRMDDASRRSTHISAELTDAGLRRNTVRTRRAARCVCLRIYVRR